MLQLSEQADLWIRVQVALDRALLLFEAGGVRITYLAIIHALSLRPRAAGAGKEIIVGESTFLKEFLGGFGHGGGDNLFEFLLLLNIAVFDVLQLENRFLDVI